MTVRMLILQHGADDPPLRLGQWLTEFGADMDIKRCYAGDEIPSSTEGYDAVISLGGVMGARDDSIAPWLPATRRLLAGAVKDQVPTLGICLGAQLLAVAAGGSVSKGPDGPEIGAYLAAKRDAAESDPLFGWLPMTPDVMQYHYDVVDRLPPGAVLLLSSMGYPHQAFRVGQAAWGVQFHFEPRAETVREWARAEGVPLTHRLGQALDDAEETMGEVWSAFTERFVALVAERSAARGGTESGLVGRRLPLAGSAEGPVSTG